MKYLLVIDHIGTGGAERIMVDYHRHLLCKGHQVKVFCLSGKKGQSKLDSDLDVVYGASDDIGNLIGKAWQQAMLLFKLKNTASQFHPDVIFSFLEKSNLLVSLVPSAKTKVLSVHNILSIQYTKVQSSIIRKILYSMIRWMYNRCPHVVAVSKQVKDDLMHSLGVKESNVCIINNFVDREDIRKKTHEKIENYIFEPHIKYVMNVGRFSDQKAQWKLLKAFSLYSNQAMENVRLVLMGQGEHTEGLKQLANDLKIADKVDFLPFNINPYKYMAHAHLFVLSSIFEGFPIVLAEVSSLRIPFVGTRKAIPEEMFDDKGVWEQCIFDSTTLKPDFSTEIHEDEKCLAKLIEKGVEDAVFRKTILSHTRLWNYNNDKSKQFEFYDSF